MVNQWIQHVKQYANQHGCSYSEALKRAKPSYKSTAKPRRKSLKGKGAFDFLDPNKNGATQFFTHDLPSDLIHQGLPIAGATLGGIAGAELGPIGSMAGSYAGQQAGKATADKIGELYGYGLYSDLKKAGKAALKKQIAHYAPAVGRHVAAAAANYAGIPSGMAGMAGHYAGQYAANQLNQAIGDGLHKKKRRSRKMKGKGNFWEDISPATTYLRPAGDALLDKTVEKIQGLGLKKRVHRKKRMTGKALYAAGYGGPM